MPAVDFGPKVEKEVERIRSSDGLTERDREVLLEYKRDMEVDGLSDGRIFKLLCHTRKIAERLGDRNLVDATEEDVKDLVAWVERRDLAEWTKTDYRRIIKRFFKWENGGECPDKVEWVKTTYRHRDKKLSEKLLNDSTVFPLISTSRVFQPTHSHPSFVWA